MTDQEARTPAHASTPAAEATPARLTCRTCRFWEHPVWSLESALVPVKVDCRRHAPAACWSGPDGVGDGAAWPRTGADDWCGDAEPVDEALEAERAAARKRFENSPFANNGVQNRPSRKER